MSEITKCFKCLEKPGKAVEEDIEICTKRKISKKHSAHIMKTSIFDETMYAGAPSKAQSRAMPRPK